MSKAILSWDLNNPDELMDFNACLKAKDMTTVLFELIYNTKKDIMWEAERYNLDAYDAVLLVYKRMHELVEEYNIDIDKLTL